jgi:hypothetical protein
MKKKTHRVRGSHRDERKIKLLLGFDPAIHSGFSGKGAFCLKVTEAERDRIEGVGIKISKRPV